MRDSKFIFKHYYHGYRFVSWKADWGDLDCDVMIKCDSLGLKKPQWSLVLGDHHYQLTREVARLLLEATHSWRFRGTPDQLFFGNKKEFEKWCEKDITCERAIPWQGTEFVFVQGGNDLGGYAALRA